MPGYRQRKLVARVKKMVKKAKTYGKKGANSLADAFSNLIITSSPAPPPNRGVLSTVSGNEGRIVVPKDTRKGKAQKGKTLAKRVPYDPDVEITALLCLNSVDDEVQFLENTTELWAEKLNVTKIAQGSYASILRMSSKSEPEMYTIWKLLPLKNSKFWNHSLCVNATLIQDAATEIMALELMNDIPGFVQLRSATVQQGVPTALLLKIFENWTNDHPEDFESVDWGEDPLWLLAEMTDAGTDLETLLSKGLPGYTFLNKQRKGARLNLEQAWDIFFLTAESLAHGEQYARFEHRDLHPGNVCIKKRDKKTKSLPRSPSVEYPKSQQVPTYTDIEVTIIDYTLSRAIVGGDQVLAPSMQDEELFKQSGKKPNDQRQYDMYRWMRDIFEGTPHPEGDTSELWKASIPMTNVRWLHHLLIILLQETEGFGKDGKGCKGKTEQRLASTLANLRTELAPENVSKCDYLTATDVIRSQLVNKAKMVEELIEEKINYPYEAQYMRELRAARSERLRCATSHS